MKKLAYLIVPSCLLATFIIWTVLVKTIDVHYIDGVGFLGFYSLNNQVNEFVNNLHNTTFKILTDLLMVIAMLTVVPFLIIGIIQLVTRKSLAKVDTILFAMLFAYVLMVTAYFSFEIVKINYSPLSTAENLKASYPSSHVLITTVMFGVATFGLIHYVKMPTLVKVAINIAFVLLALAVTALRLGSGQHYLTDIIGGVLLSVTILACFISLNSYLNNLKKEENNN